MFVLYTFRIFLRRIISYTLPGVPTITCGGLFLNSKVYEDEIDLIEHQGIYFSISITGHQ